MEKACLFLFLMIISVAAAQAQICRSSIPFGIDVSLALTPEEFTMMKNFVLNPFLSQLFPNDIEPNLYAIFSYGATVYVPQNVTDIMTFISNLKQGAVVDSYFVSPLSYLLYYNVFYYTSLSNLPQNLVVFTGGSLHDEYFEEVKNDTEILTVNGNTVIVVFVRPNMNQTNYKRIPGLKLVEWSNDSAVLLANIRKNMNCFGDSSTIPPTTTTHPRTTTTAPRKTTTSVKTTTLSRMTTTSSISACKSHIPFAYDVSKSLTSDQYSFEEQLILNPFLSELFPTNVQPSWFGIFDTSAYFPKSRPKNVSEITNFVNLYPQLTGKTGNIDVILKQLVARNIFSDNDRLPVNTVIFTGSELPSASIEVTISIAKSFTTSNNTLTIVLTKPNINKKNYQAVALVSGTILVQYNQNKQEMVADIRQTMNCS